jgi:phosphoenolpyruvate carboxykinase (GTP)
LVFEAKDWAHGVLVGAAMGSETTAAATGAVGVLRRDSMAMKPFCGYNFADYFAHWLSFDKPGAKLPRIFHVNWFRKDSEGQFMWPGYGDNLRVLDWMIQRVEGRAEGTETPIGTLPARDELNVEGLDLTPGTLDELLRVDVEGWQEELRAIGLYLDGFGQRMPEKLKAERLRVSKALDAAVIRPAASVA